MPKLHISILLETIDGPTKNLVIRSEVSVRLANYIRLSTKDVSFRLGPR